MPPVPNRFTAANAIPSSFKFAESINTDPLNLPRSDYYRAQHMLNRVWSQVGPKYFPDRSQPQWDPQIAPNAPDTLYPGSGNLGNYWAGLAFPRSTALTPGLPIQDWQPGVLPHPGVYGLDADTVQNLAHPQQYSQMFGLQKPPLNLP